MGELIDERVAPTSEALRVADGIHPKAGQALKDYLRGKTSPDEAARAIMAPTLANPVEWCPTANIWGTLAQVLVELEVEREKIYKFIPAIQKLPPSDGCSFESLDELCCIWASIYRTHHYRSLPEYLEKGPITAEEISSRRDYLQSIGTAEAGLLIHDLGYQKTWLYYGLDVLHLVLDRDVRSLDMYIGLYFWLVGGSRQ